MAGSVKSGEGAFRPTRLIQAVVLRSPTDFRGTVDHSWSLRCQEVRCGRRRRHICRRQTTSTAAPAVALPRDYALAVRHYPLTIVLDAQDRRLLDLVRAAARADLVLDFLGPVMPDQIVVGVESVDRGRKFGRDAAAFRRFLEQELVPTLVKRFRLGTRHTIVGRSLAGALAIDAMCAAPERYYRVVAISPALEDSVETVGCVWRVARATALMPRLE
jgi:enterochelin esterase-like enzyme